MTTFKSNLIITAEAVDSIAKEIINRIWALKKINRDLKDEESRSQPRKKIIKHLKAHKANYAIELEHFEKAYAKAFKKFDQYQKINIQTYSY